MAWHGSAQREPARRGRWPERPSGAEDGRVETTIAVIGGLNMDLSVRVARLPAPGRR
ncbi:hypothetical protein ACFQ9X_14195 [Catenulispora yoronensis]